MGAVLGRVGHCKNIHYRKLETVKVLVCGCGRIGSPMLTWIAHNNIDDDDIHVDGVDVDPKIMGSVYPRFSENGWKEKLDELQAAGKIPKIIPYSSIYHPYDVILITCGTPIDKNQNPDSSQVMKAIESLVHSGAVNDKTLIIMRSTLFPGCTRLIQKILECEYGLKPHIVMAPERIAEGNTFLEIDRLPQIIGADSDEAMDLAIDFFNNVFGSDHYIGIPLKSGGTVAAELAKLMCNTYRYINFAMANEFAIICDENNVHFPAVQRACNFNYERCNIANAALNVGGPCLGKDAKTLAAGTRNAKITEAAYEVAEKTVMHFVEKHKALIKNNQVGVLGLAFKANSDNNMNSLSYKLIKQLEILGADVFCHDPSINLTRKGSCMKAQYVIDNCDIVFVMTEHDEYKDLQFLDFQTVVRF